MVNQYAFWPNIFTFMTEGQFSVCFGIPRMNTKLLLISLCMTYLFRLCTFLMFHHILAIQIDWINWKIAEMNKKYYIRYIFKNPFYLDATFVPYKTFRKAEFTVPEPQTTKTKSPRSHGPTGYFSWSGRFWKMLDIFRKA